MSSDVCLIEFLIFGVCLTRFGPTSRTQCRYLERPLKSYHVMQKLSTSRKNTDALTQSKKSLLQLNRTSYPDCVREVCAKERCT